MKHHETQFQFTYIWWFLICVPYMNDYAIWYFWAENWTLNSLLRVMGVNPSKIFCKLRATRLPAKTYFGTRLGSTCGDWLNVVLAVDGSSTEFEGVRIAFFHGLQGQETTGKKLPPHRILFWDTQDQDHLFSLMKFATGIWDNIGVSQK